MFHFRVINLPGPGPTRRFLVWTWWAFRATFALVLDPAAAADLETPIPPSDFFTPRIFGSERYDSNLFRLDADDRSSNTTTGGVGLNLDQKFGLQEISIDGSVTRYLYSHFPSLDATGHDLEGRFDWKLTADFAGELLVIHRAVPADFADSGFQTSANLYRYQEERLTTDWRPGAALHPRLTLSNRENKSDRQGTQPQNSRVRSFGGGLVYEFVSGNSLEAYYRKANGNYLGEATQAVQFAKYFTEYEAGARYNWAISGLSVLSGRIGFLSRTNDTYSSRDYAGLVGDIHLHYDVSGKTGIDIIASRSVYTLQSLTSSYYTDELLTAGLPWEITGKLELKPQFTYLHRQLGGAVIGDVSNRRESTRGFAAVVTWIASRSVDVTLTIGNATRRSNEAFFNYGDRVAELDVNFPF